MISDEIRKARKAKGITQEDLAKKLGINRATVSKYESGAVVPSVEQLTAISSALNVPIGSLMGLENMGGGFYGKEVADSVYAQIAENVTLHHGIKAMLNTAFDRLNDEGQQKAVERVEELTEIPKYRKETPPQD